MTSTHAEVPPIDELERVLVASTRFKPAAHPVARRIASWFEERGVDTRLDLEGGRPLREAAREVQLVVCVGGDGTILGLARAIAGVEVPTLGVNLGKLGFLAEFTATDIRAYIDGGEAPFQVVPRLMLACRLADGEPIYALNDAVLTQGPMSRILTIEMAVNDRKATRYHADGVVISSPVGSTAYSLSLGAPLLTPDTGALIVTPIAPHTLTDRPLVLQERTRLSFRILRESPTLSLVIDGQEHRALNRGDEIRIQAAESRFLLASDSRRTFFDVLRRKLHWAIAPTVDDGAASDPVRPGIVYLHGFASSPAGTKGRFVTERLRAAGYDVEAPDLNDGEGGFERLTLSRMLAEARAACARLRERLDVGADGPVVLIGSSLGGYVAALAAARDPAIRALVLLAPAFAFIERFRDALPDEERARVDREGAIEVDHHAYGDRRRLSAEILEDGLDFEAFPEVLCPILIVHGRGDEVVPAALSERFAECRPNVRLDLVDDEHRLAGSLDRIGKKMDAFLEEVAARG